jgi:acyl-CoA synthetase (AMP-forming)/AMP-acid ligase II
MEKKNMLGLMQNHPLLISSLIEHAGNAHPNAEVVSRTLEGSIHRCTYTDIERRAKQVASALTAKGVTQADRIGTLAWNGYRHLELYFGVSGLGAVLQDCEPPFVPGAARIHHQPRRGSVSFFRRLLFASGRETRTETENGKSVYSFDG